MTRLKKTVTLAAALTATLLLSTSLAGAEPAHRNPAQTAAHSGDRGPAPSQFRSDKTINDGRGQQERYARDRRANRADYGHARYADRFHRPPLRFERIGRAPHAGRIWQTGRWDWHGGHWVWIGGMWNVAANAHR